MIRLSFLCLALVVNLVALVLVARVVLRENPAVFCLLAVSVQLGVLSVLVYDAFRRLRADRKSTGTRDQAPSPLSAKP